MSRAKYVGILLLVEDSYVIQGRTIQERNDSAIATFGLPGCLLIIDLGYIS